MEIKPLGQPSPDTSIPDESLEAKRTACQLGSICTIAGMVVCAGDETCGRTRNYARSESPSFVFETSVRASEVGLTFDPAAYRLALSYARGYAIPEDAAGAEAA